MKRKVRIFIYALVAWFVGLAVISYDVAVSYAASFNEDVTDAEWHYFNSTGEDSIDKLEIYDYDEVGTDIKIPADSKIYDCKYIDKFTCAKKGTGDYYKDTVYMYDYTIGSDSEVVLVYENYGLEASNNFFYAGDSTSTYCDGTFSYLLSKDLFYYFGGYVNKKGSDYNYEFKTKEAYHMNGYGGLYTYPVNYGAYRYDISYKAINSHKMKVFFSVADAAKYLNDCDLSGLAWQGKSKEYDGDSIYLNDFQMVVHDSNAYSAYYLEFKYTIPEQLRDAVSLQLQIEQSFEWTSCALGDSIRRPYTYTGNNYIDLLQYPTGFKLYLDDITSIQQFLDSIQLTHHQRAVLGSETILDMSALSIAGFGGETIMRITNSKLYITCYVIANNKFGVNYTGSVDFITGSNDMSSYTPDSSGNYKYNDDIKTQGHYYTDASTDAAGNTTYNYYYYGTDNSVTEISAKDSADNTLTVVPVPGQSGSIINNITIPDHIFVNVSGSSGGSSSGGDVGNVTIEDDDLSFDGLRESIKDGYGLIDDTDTGAKGDGLIAMLSDLFGYLPAKFVGLIMLGTSSVVGIAVLRMIFKR